VLKLGEFALSRVIESEEPLLDPKLFFPDSTPDVFRSHAHWLEPTHVQPGSGLLILCMQSYVLRTARHTILVDACVGDDKDRAAHRMSWHMRRWPYLENLARAGFKPEDIDFVLCTHLHTDHVGWNTRLENGRWVPTFPNAKYIFARKELAFWESRTGAAQPQSIRDSVLPIVEAKRAVLVEGDHQIDDGVWFEPAPGHTEGNVVVNVESAGRRAVLCGDVIHHPVQLVRPEWSSRACEDKVQSAVTRRALLERLCDTDTLLAPAHFASPSIGRVIRQHDHFGYRE
jgi:glyoxylase-like metal-dependent hydrolase (beta-lactamase superfamily II)